MTRIIPNKGDFIIINFSPQAGHEQAGTRPALVISSYTYNKISRLAIVCPITNQSKGYPFEVPIPSGLNVTGYVISDQVKNLDIYSRGFKIIGQAPDDLINKVCINIASLLDITIGIQNPISKAVFN